MKKSIVHFGLLVFFFSLTHLSATNWQKTSGPYHGVINRVFVDRVNPAILYAAMPFKILKTTTEGREWQTLLQSAKPIYIFAVAPGNQNIIYTNTQKSLDGGQNWLAIQPVPYSKIEFGQQTPDDIENKLAIHPNDANILFAALSSFGMYRSTDGAQSWNIIPGAPQGLVIFDAANSAQLFCAGNDSLYFSSNNGNAWTAMGAYPEATKYTPKKIIYQDGTLYILLASGVEGLQGQMIIRSKNNGIDWTILPFNISFSELLSSINSIAYGSGSLFAATNIGLYRSIDEGLTWSRFSGDYDDIAHVDLTNRLICGSKNFGVSVTRDLNNSWQNIGVENIASTEAAVISSPAGELFLQWRGAIYRLNEENNSWQSLIPPHSTIPVNGTVSVSKVDSTTLFTVYSHLFLKYKMDDKIWSIGGNFPETPGAKIAHGPDDELLFCLTENGNLYRSINAGISWDKLDTPIGETILDFHFSDKKNLYLLTDLNYYSSVNSGGSFQALRSGLPGVNLQSTEIWFERRQTDHLFLQVQDKIFQKKSAAALWEIFYPQSSLIFPQIAQRLIASPDSSGDYYSVIPRYFDGATYLAHYNQPSREWRPIATNLDSVSLHNFDFTTYAPYRLFHLNSKGEFWLGDVRSDPDTIDFTSARVQLSHNAADPLLDSLDIYLNNIKIADNIKFAQATPFVDLPAGTLIRLAAAPANSFSALDSLMSMMVTLDQQKKYLINLTGVLDTTKFALNPGYQNRALRFNFTGNAEENSLIADKLYFNFQNNISDAPAIDLIARNLAQLADSVSFTRSSEYILLTPDKYTFDLKPYDEDSTRLASFILDLRNFGGKAFTLSACGFLDPAKNKNGASIALRAVFPSGQIVEFERESGSAGSPAKVILANPANAAFNVSLRPTLFWRPTPKATSYHVQLDTHPSFTSIIFDAKGNVDTTVIVSGLAENQTYYWRVQAQNSEGMGLWSTVWHFTTTSSTAAPAAPALISPVNAVENLTTNVDFRWTPVDNAQNYTLEYSFSNLFSPALQLRNIPDTTFSVDTLQHNTTYYWHVRAVNSTGKSDWSATYHFTTIKAPDPLELPQLISPVDGAENIFTNITLQWAPVPGANSYSLEVSNDENFSPAIFYNAIADTFKRVFELNNATTYYWRISAADSTRASDWSEPFRFTTVPNYPLAFAVVETLAIPAFMQDAKLKTSDYRIIGFPGNAQVPIDSIFTGKQDSSWSVYWDNGALSNYLQPFDSSESFHLQTGRAFWVLHKGPIVLNRKMATAKLDSSGFVNLPVHLGWNLITNPFTSAISWQLVQEYNEIYQPIWDYDGSFLEADSLIPFKGYYFFNIKNLQNIRIPYDALFEIDSSTAGQQSTAIKISWWSKNLQPETIKAGFLSRAKKGVDQFDAAKPHAPDGAAGLYFKYAKRQNQQQKFAIDYRPGTAALQRWEIMLETKGAQHGALIIDYKKEKLHAKGLFLHDHQSGKIIELDEHNELPQRLKSSLSRWTLIAAQREALTDYQIETMKTPLQIDHPSPNPFTKKTRLRILSQKDQHVSISVYNILGKRVTELFNGKISAGWHEVYWAGQNQHGVKVGSGLYFIIAEYAGSRISKKTIFLH